LHISRTIVHRLAAGLSPDDATELTRVLRGLLTPPG
jgi:hypothetical protein